MENWKRNLYILWFTQILSIMGFGFGLPFMPFYIQELGVVDPDRIKLFTGMLSMAPAITMGIMAPIWGILSDRFGRKLMIMRAMLAATFVIGGMGLAGNVWHLVGLRFAQGLFTGTVTAATTFVASDTPSDRMSFAIGFMSSSTFIGMSIGPVIGGLLAEGLGYRFSFLAGAVIMFIGFLLVLLLVRENRSAMKPGSNEKGRKAYQKIFTPLVVMLLVVLMLHRITRSLFSPYLPLFIQEMLETTTGAARLTGYANGLVSFATASAGLTISRFGDRVNKVNLITVLLGSALVISVLLNYTHTLWSFILLYGLMFFFLGGVEPIVVSTTAQSTPPEHRGSLFGFQGLVGSIGMILSPMMGVFVSVQYGVKSILWVIVAVILINFMVVRAVAYRKLG